MGRDSPGERRSPRAFWVSKGPFQPHSAEFRHPPGEPGDVITAHGVRMLMAERHERDGEDVLRLIAQKERELEAMVARAREEAARLVEQARREVEAQLQKAREEAARVAEEYEARAQAEAREISEEVVGRARTEAEALRRRAAQHMDEAVRVVVEQVVGGAGGGWWGVHGSCGGG